MMLFWLAMILLCCVIVSFRLAISSATFPSPVLSPARLGVKDTRAVGNGGSPFCDSCNALYAGSFGANCDAVGGGSFYANRDPVAPGLFCADRSAAIRVLSDCRATSTSTLGFLMGPFSGAAGGARGGVDMRSGVEAAIGAPALCWAGRRGHLAARTS
ncbi:hypothetical protein K469DRAFT_695082 [Zopfia rhizophila CBS 207.26]|uniref:Uncharacterized protein n=1 Tax=Zopfia rhizophila CBS 207.26 TaxID=1314779 RepID=A0A6A6DHI3_9PEZI|nr:hypothetical protein K469DRAFT_695082 [Zopfia rhizophila CBS 207.26]